MGYVRDFVGEALSMRLPSGNRLKEDDKIAAAEDRLGWGFVGKCTEKRREGVFLCSYPAYVSEFASMIRGRPATATVKWRLLT